MLDALPEGTFQVVVTGDAVTQGKPHPEPYLKAAALLGVDPRDAVAIEDSNTGTRSAEAAGCTVLVVPNHVPVLEGERRVFTDLLPATLQELARRPRVTAPGRPRRRLSARAVACRRTRDTTSDARTSHRSVRGWAASRRCPGPA